MGKHKKKVIVREGKLGEEIVYPEDTDYVEHKNKLLPSRIIFCAIVGRTGAGKSYYLLKILPLMTDKVKHVVICSRITGHPIHKQIARWCRLRDKSYTFVNDVDDGKRILAEKAKECKESGDHFVTIFDDFGSYSRNLRARTSQLMTETFSQLRNFNGHGIVIIQDMCCIPTPLRQNLNFMVSFGGAGTGSQTQTTSSMSFVSGCLDRNIFRAINAAIAKSGDPHGFVMCRPGAIYMNWTKIWPFEQAEPASAIGIDKYDDVSEMENGVNKLRIKGKTKAKGKHHEVDSDSDSDDSDDDHDSDD